MTAEGFLRACRVGSVSDLAPEELIDFASRYMDETSSAMASSLAGHPFGAVPDWKKVARLIAEAYGKGLVFHYHYVTGEGVHTEGYEENPEEPGLQYGLADGWPPV